MRSPELNGYTPPQAEDSDLGLGEPEIDIKQMEKNGVIFIENLPEGIQLLGEPFPAYSLWANMSERPQRRRG